MASRSQILADNNSSFPNNNSGQITPAILRDYNAELANSVRFLDEPVPTASFANNATSASFALTASYALNAGTTIDTGSFVTTSSFNAFSSSVDSQLTALEDFSSSLDATFATTAELNAYTASNDAALGALSSSYVATSGSVNQLLAFSSSLDATFATDAQLNAATASLSASLAVSINTKLDTTTFNAFTSSIQAEVNALEAATSSYVTNAQTSSMSVLSASFATTASFASTAAQATSASYATNAGAAQTATSASYALNSTSASYASQAQNAVSASYAATASSADTFIVRNALTASGLNYPTADGVLDQFLSTDGAGNLTFDWVKTLHQNIRNVDSVTISRGTPLFVSGSTGDNANVYVADANNPARRPATLIAFDATLAPSATGTAIISGEIQGVDTNAYAAGTVVYLAAGGGWTPTRPTGSSSVQVLGVVTSQANNGRGIVFNQVADALPNIQSGYTWVGDANGVPQAVSTGSINAATAVSASFASTIASGLNITASNLSVTNDATIGGNLTVNGTASFNYVETVTGSAVIIGQEYIILNTQLPSARYAGLVVYDSGSTNTTASIVWDSQTNHWVYEYGSGSYTGGGFLAGPRNTGSLADIKYPTLNKVVRGQGGDHLYDSNITDNDTNIILGINTEITGTLGVTGAITGNLTGTASYATYAANAGNAATATSASYADNATSASYAVNSTSASYAVNSTSASYAATASYYDGSVVSASYALSASEAQHAVSADSATTATSASYATNSTSASYALSAESASFAQTASFYGGSVVSASYALSSSFASNAETATSASFATTASYAENAVSASYAPSTPAFPFTGSAQITGSLGVTGSYFGKPQYITTERSFPILEGQDDFSVGGNVILTRTQLAISTGSVAITGSNNFIALSNGAGNTFVNNGGASIIRGINSIILGNSVPTITGSNGSGYNRTGPLFSNSISLGSLSLTDNRPSALPTFYTNTNSVVNGSVTATISTGSVNISNSNINASLILNVTGSSGTPKGILNNTIGGQVTLNLSATGTTLLQNNLLVGSNIVASLSDTNSYLIGVSALGNGLTVSGSTSTVGGSVYVGRWNALDSTSQPGLTAFAVGTGTAAGSRRTSLHVSASGLTTISDLSATGNLQGTASYATQALSASWAPTQAIDTSAFATTGSNTFIGNQTVTGSLVATGQSTFEDGIVVNQISAQVTGIDGPDITISPYPSGIVRLRGGASVEEGALSVTGSLFVSSSTRGNIVPVTATSNTASLDLNLGNAFLFTISGSNLLNITNYPTGSNQKFSLMVETSAVSSSITFGDEFLFPSGTFYTPTVASGSVDILTFETYTY